MDKPLEWSVGCGQCPSCNGLGPAFGHPLDFRKDSVGHESNCELAKLMTDAGKSPVMKPEGSLY